MAISPEWAPLLEQARKDRGSIWASVMADLKAAGETLPENASEIGGLYVDLRIDFARANQALATGDLSTIAIDPRPEDAPKDAYTVLDAYFSHFRRVVDETLIEHRLTEIDLASKAHSDLFNATELRLFDAGKSINPLL